MDNKYVNETLIKTLQEAYDEIGESNRSRKVNHETWIQSAIKEAMIILENLSIPNESITEHISEDEEKSSITVGEFEKHLKRRIEELKVSEDEELFVWVNCSDELTKNEVIYKCPERGGDLRRVFMMKFERRLQIENFFSPIPIHLIKWAKPITKAEHNISDYTESEENLIKAIMITLMLRHNKECNDASIITGDIMKEFKDINSKSITNNISDQNKIEKISDEELGKMAERKFPKFGLVNNHDWCNLKDGFIEGAKAIMEILNNKGSDAVEFADWCGLNRIKVHGGWFHLYDDQRNLKNLRTTEYLYEQFLKTKHPVND